MKKHVNPLIFTATFLLGQTTAYAHGAHGSETNLMHILTEPQHLFGFLAASTALSLFMMLRKSK
ncbi:MAG: hypothetical protein ACPH95_03815, partial [Porticoccaceae bacterium]